MGKVKGKTDHKWTHGEVLFLKRYYRHNAVSAKEVGRRLGVSEHAVRMKLAQLGLLRGYTRWTPEEEEYMIRNYGKLQLRVICTKLGKSANATAKKAYLLGLSTRIRTRNGWFTKGDICEILGVAPGWLDTRLNGVSGILKMNSHHPDKVPRAGAYIPWHISKKAFRDFLRRYPGELTGLPNVDFVSLVDVLCGIILPANYIGEKKGER